MLLLVLFLDCFHAPCHPMIFLRYIRNANIWLVSQNPVIGPEEVHDIQDPGTNFHALFRIHAKYTPNRTGLHEKKIKKRLWTRFHMFTDYNLKLLLIFVQRNQLVIYYIQKVNMPKIVQTTKWYKT